jgi:hypothetical protein
MPRTLLAIVAGGVCVQPLELLVLSLGIHPVLVMSKDNQQQQYKRTTAGRQQCGRTNLGLEALAFDHSPVGGRRAEGEGGCELDKSELHG